MPKPKKMRYDSQAILRLAPDLENDAINTQKKREEAGDVLNAFDHSKAKSRIFRGAQVNGLPIEYRQATSRIFIIAHGDENSTFIADAENGGNKWSPEALYLLLKAWMSDAGYLPTRVQRISLLTCNSGGNRGNTSIAGSGASQAGFTVRPEQSFAYKFARIAGCLTADVTARTDVMIGGSQTNNGVFVTAYQTVGMDNRRHKEGDKFVFTTVAGSTPTAPQDPTFHATWK